ncbi:snaclec alboaggregin-A subunit beta'-like [Stigmatopora argus]
MTLFLRSLFLFCGFSALLTGANCFSFWNVWKTINNCPKGWTQLDCHCYRFLEEVRDSADAESICQSLGGNLVSIQNLLENAFIAGISEDAENDLIWLGINDLASGDFTWNDGASSDFSNFDPSGTEPDGSGSCVAMDVTDGFWQDEDCSTEDYSFVCIRNVETH